jgi:hypothetical protein
LVRFDDREDVAVRAADPRVHRRHPWPGQEKCTYALIHPDGYVWWAADEPGDVDIADTLRALGMRLT